MSRKNEPSADGTPDRNSAALKTLRSQIDKIDLQIVECLHKRAAVASQIGKVKSESGGEVYSSSREEEVLKNVLTGGKGPLTETSVRAIFKELIAGCRSLQRMRRVAFVGPEFSYAHIAAIERFGKSVEFHKVGSVSAVFEEIASHHADDGIVPIENSIEGSVSETLESFLAFPDVKIVGEVRVDVHQNLLANCEQTAITRVYGRPIALNHCRKWLSKNLPHVTLHEVAATADAALLARRDPHAACIGGRHAAVEFGLRTLREQIEDNSDDRTRYAVLSRTEAEEGNKTALIFEVSHGPGALVDALTVFKQNKININWIESFPHKFDKKKQVFFIDFDGRYDDTKVKKTLKALEETCESVVILGSFSCHSE